MVMAEKNGTEIILCVNKCDLAEGDRRAAKKAQESIASLQRIYGSVYPVLLMDPDREESLAEFRTTLGKKVALAGASGVGKSTILTGLSLTHKLRPARSAASPKGKRPHVMRSCFLSMRSMAQ